MGPAQSFWYLGTFLTGGHLVNQNAIFLSSKQKPKCEVVWGQLHCHLQVSANGGEHIAFTVERSAYGHNVSTHLQGPERSYTMPLNHCRLK